MPGSWHVWLLTPALAFAQPAYEIAGRITPEGRASVSLFRVASPFTVSTLSDDDGRFAFKRIEPGAYTISVFLPSRGEARRTIEIGPSTADAKLRVALALDFKEADFTVAGALRAYHAVPASQLSISAKARREYEEAQKELSRGNAEGARKRLEHAVELSPQFSAAWNNLGTIAYQTRQFPRAEECFREALAQDPQSFEALVNLGGVLINLHKLDEAWDYNLHAVLMRPEDALANSQMGMTYHEMGRSDLALKYFETARRVDPAHFSHPQLFLAEIHLRNGNRMAAAEALEDFLRHHPDWPQAARMKEKIAELRK